MVKVDAGFNDSYHNASTRQPTLPGPTHIRVDEGPARLLIEVPLPWEALRSSREKIRIVRHEGISSQLGSRRRKGSGKCQRHEGQPTNIVKAENVHLSAVRKNKHRHALAVGKLTGTKSS